MDIGQLTERLMGMDDRTWARHANPWSGWSRVTILPLLALTLWFRAGLGLWTWAALLGLVLWTWLNPRLFPEPRHLNGWMSRGVLGERIWLARKTTPIPAHHAHAALILNSVAAAGTIPLALGLWRYEAGLALAGLALTMGGKLWFLDRMVWLLADTQNSHRC
ncbi:hypothetical protein LCM16_01120 [Mameliella alba]|nr:hypothetical protein [Mameliella alba]